MMNLEITRLLLLPPRIPRQEQEVTRQKHLAHPLVVHHGIRTKKTRNPDALATRTMMRLFNRKTRTIVEARMVEAVAVVVLPEEEQEELVAGRDVEEKILTNQNPFWIFSLIPFVQTLIVFAEIEEEGKMSIIRMTIKPLPLAMIPPM
jgi:hypothetical protein